MDYVALVLLLGIAATYVLRSLLLRELDDHFGPLRSSERWVRFEDGHLQPVTLFDWIRRLGGVYTISKDPAKSFEWWWWDVRTGEEKVERFTCTHCLSWWTALPFSLVFVYATFGLSLRLLWLIPTHFAIAILSQLCYKILWGDDE